jgi:hypothetical protein
MQKTISELLSASGLQLFNREMMNTGRRIISYVYNKEMLEKHLCLYFYQYISPENSPKEEYESVIGVYGFDEVSTFDINLFYDTTMDLGAKSMCNNIMSIVAFISERQASTLPDELENISPGKKPKKLLLNIRESPGIELFHRINFGYVLFLNRDLDLMSAYSTMILTSMDAQTT